MKKKKIGVLVSAIATCAVCASMVAGSTFALFTDEDSVSVAVTAATVKVDVEITDKAVTSAIDPAAEVYGGFTGTDGLTLTDVTPGETYSFTVKATNASSIAALCKTSVVFSNTALASAFQVTIGETEYGAVKSYSTAWTRVEAETALADLPVEITFPYSADSQNEFQGLKTDIAVKVEAVQANAQGYTAGGEPDVVEIPADAKVVSTAEDLKTAIEEGGYVILSEDMAVSEMSVVAGKTTLDLNGHTLTNNVVSDRLFWITDPNVSFTINGVNGGIVIPTENVDSYGIVDVKEGATDATVTVNGGNYVGNTNVGGFFRVRAANWTLQLNEVNCQTNYLIVAVDDTLEGTLTVKGGEYNVLDRNIYAGFYFGKTTATFEGVTIKSNERLALEGINSTIIFKDCNIDYPQGYNYFSTAVSAGNYDEVTVSNGNYGGDNAVYVFSTGGTINVTGGQFKGEEAAIRIDLGTGAGNYVRQDGVVNIYDGEFDGAIIITKEATHSFIGGEEKTFYGRLTIYGGTFKNTGLSAEEFAQYVDENSTYTYDEATDTYTVKAN